MSTTDQAVANLATIARQHARAQAHADNLLEQRDRAIIAALKAGVTHTHAGELTGLTRGRIAQISLRAGA